MTLDREAIIEPEVIPGVSAPPPTPILGALAPIAAVAILMALVPLWLGDSRFMMRLAVDALVFGAYAVGFNLIFGSTSQLFLCVGAIAGTGAYASAILADRVGLPLLVALPMATALAAGLGGLLSWVAARRSLGLIFTGIVTLAFGLSFQSLLLGQRALTGGETGLVVTSGVDTFLRSRTTGYYTFVGLVVAFLIVFRLVQRSHLGWAFRALRDGELAAELAGVSVARYRVYAALIGSAMLGLTGALYAHAGGFVSPSTFAFGHVDVRVLVMLAFGGLGTLLGPVVGTAVFAGLDEILANFGQLRTVVYGVLIILLFLSFRRGAVPAVVYFLDRHVRRPRSASRWWLPS